MLCATRISKSFSGTIGLDDVSVTLNPGEIVVVLGPSGSGKTTLLRSLSMLDPIDAGTLEIDGQVYQSSKYTVAPQEIYPPLGVVFQNLALWPHLTLRENILMPLRLKRAITNDTYVAQLIDTFSMRSFVDRYPRQVSGGERQRAAIVRALALRPTYLLLDEITSALDVEQVVVVLHELERLKHEGVGILLITHLIGFARRAADRFIFLDKGRIADQGEPELLEAPRNPRLQSFLSYLAQAT